MAAALIDMPPTTQAEAVSEYHLHDLPIQGEKVLPTTSNSGLYIESQAEVSTESDILQMMRVLQAFFG